MWLIEYIIQKLHKKWLLERNVNLLKLSKILYFYTIKNPQICLDVLKFEFWYNIDKWVFSLDALLYERDKKYKSYILLSDFEAVDIIINSLSDKEYKMTVNELEHLLESNNSLFKNLKNGIKRNTLITKETIINSSHLFNKKELNE